MITWYRSRHSLLCPILKARSNNNLSYTGTWLWHTRVEIRTWVWSTHLTLAPCVVTRALTSYNYSIYISSSKQHIHLPISRARSIQSMTPSHFLKSHFNIILPSTLGLPRGLFPSVFPPQPCVHLFCLPYLPNSPPISFLLIWSHEWRLISRTEHKAIQI